MSPATRAVIQALYLPILVLVLVLTAAVVSDPPRAYVTQPTDSGWFRKLTPSVQRDSIVAIEARKANVPVSLALAVSHTENWTGD